jgi:hypothetical protein
VPACSLAPGKTCIPSAPCFKSGKCYALKAFRQYPNTRAAWLRNTELAFRSPAEFCSQLREFFQRKQPAFFRWHVSGDIINQEYLENMKTLAAVAPKTNSLAFTKRHYLDYTRLPKNLSVVFSMWPGLPVPKRRNPRIRYAWYQDGTETRIPKTALQCPGSCENCMMCWELHKIGRDVWFAAH